MIPNSSGYFWYKIRPNVMIVVRVQMNMRFVHPDSGYLEHVNDYTSSVWCGRVGEMLEGCVMRLPIERRQDSL